MNMSRSDMNAEPTIDYFWHLFIFKTQHAFPNGCLAFFRTLPTEGVSTFKGNWITEHLLTEPTHQFFLNNVIVHPRRHDLTSHFVLNKRTNSKNRHA